MNGTTTLPDGEADAASAIVESIIAALSGADWESGLSLLDAHWIEAWFYLPPDDVKRLLAAAPADVLSRHPAAQFLLSIVSGGARPTIPPAEQLRPDSRGRMLMQAMEIAELRLSGRSSEALAGTRAAIKQSRGSESVLIDTSGGLVPFVFLQAGLTALLAGELGTAKAWLSRARDDTGSSLRFVRRDAAAKLAVLHALAGGTTEAQAYLQEALSSPRSRAWTEHWIDSTAQIAQVLIEMGDRKQAAALGRLPWRVLGEMWPFALVAQVRALLEASDLDAAQHAITTVEAMELPGADGDGFVAGVIPLAFATVALARGNQTEARRQLERAPAGLPFTRSLAARSELMAGRYRAAARQATVGITEFGGFAQLAFEFSGILAAAELDDGNADAARRAARELVRHWHEMPPIAHRRIPAELLVHARIHWHDDPELGLLATTEIDSIFPSAAGQVELSEREQEVLMLLATPATRRELCDQLFISTNTLASHIKSIYRKLGVTSRDDAVQQAGTRGLLQQP